MNFEMFMKQQMCIAKRNLVEPRTRLYTYGLKDVTFTGVARPSGAMDKEQ